MKSPVSFPRFAGLSQFRDSNSPCTVGAGNRFRVSRRKFPQYTNRLVWHQHTDYARIIHSVLAVIQARPHPRMILTWAGESWSAQQCHQSALNVSRPWFAHSPAAAAEISSSSLYSMINNSWASESNTLNSGEKPTLPNDGSFGM